MIINNNMNAMNAHRNMSFNTTQTGKAMEKLSSGLRINRAGDDAAGLAISEKMRAQVRGLDQATRNAQDGISLIQTAEGALNETHSILQRMRELAVQSSNDTNTDADRASINTEITQLKDEVDRIGNTTEFNTKKLIDGSIGQKQLTGSDKAAVISSALGKETAATVTTAEVDDAAFVPANGTLNLKIDGANISVSLTASDYTGFKSGAVVNTEAYAAKLQEDINSAIEAYNKSNDTKISNVTVTESAATDGTISIKSGSVGATSTVDVVASATSAAYGLTANATTPRSSTGLEGTFSAAGAAQVTAIANSATSAREMTMTIDGTDIKVDLATVGVATYNANADMSTFATNLQSDINTAITKYNATVPTEKQVQSVNVSIKDGSVVVESGSDKATSSIKFDNSEAAQLLGLAKQNSATQGGGLDFQIGANQKQTMKVTIEDMRTDALKIKDVDLSTKAGAQEALTKINDAIEKVSSQRSNLGAFQNRLEHTINNLGTSAENLTAAESRIRDVDMAKEMMNFTKNNILNQAAQAMLSQANQQPQAVLQLLR